MPLFIPTGRTNPSEHLADKYVTFDDLVKYTLYYDPDYYTGSTINGVNMATASQAELERARKNIVTSGATASEIPWFKKNRAWADGHAAGIKSNLGVRWEDTTEFNPYVFMQGGLLRNFNVKYDGTDAQWNKLRTTGNYGFRIKLKNSENIYTLTITWSTTYLAWVIELKNGTTTIYTSRITPKSSFYITDAGFITSDVEYIEWYSKPTFSSSSSSDNVSVVENVTVNYGYDEDNWGGNASIVYGQRTNISNIITSSVIAERNYWYTGMQEIDSIASNYNITAVLEIDTRVIISPAVIPKITVTVPYSFAYPNNSVHDVTTMKISVVGDIHSTWAETVASTTINGPAFGVQLLTGETTITFDNLIGEEFDDYYLKVEIPNYAHDRGYTVDRGIMQIFNEDYLAGVQVSGTTQMSKAVYVGGISVSSIDFDGYWQYRDGYNPQYDDPSTKYIRQPFVADDIASASSVNTFIHLTGSEGTQSYRINANAKWLDWHTNQFEELGNLPFNTIVSTDAFNKWFEN